MIQNYKLFSLEEAEKHRETLHASGKKAYFN